MTYNDKLFVALALGFAVTQLKHVSRCDSKMNTSTVVGRALDEAIVNVSATTSHCPAHALISDGHSLGAFIVFVQMRGKLGFWEGVIERPRILAKDGNVKNELGPPNGLRANNEIL